MVIDFWNEKGVFWDKPYKYLLHYKIFETKSLYKLYYTNVKELTQEFLIQSMDEKTWDVFIFNCSLKFECLVLKGLNSTYLFENNLLAISLNSILNHLQLYILNPWAIYD